MMRKIFNFQFLIFNNRGFTLIELIIVTAIIALIATASIAVLNPFSQFQKARDSRIKSDLSQIQKALETYYQDKGSYPSSTSGYKISDSTTINWGSSWQPYMNVVPKDPTLSNNYVYYAPNGQSYYIYANLGRGAADPQICKNLNANGECPSVPAVNLCGAKCNFGVSSPNITP